MDNNYYEFFKKITLLEIVTLRDIPQSRDKFPNGNLIRGVHYKSAYEGALQSKFPFDKIDWAKPPFDSFSVLKLAPPKSLMEDQGRIKFSDQAAPVLDWDTFIDSFKKVRNNICHGAKLFKDGDLRLDDRDGSLILAALAFIQFLQNEGLVKDLY